MYIPDNNKRSKNDNRFGLKLAILKDLYPKKRHLIIEPTDIPIT